jgi:hypothetical protein
MSFTVLRYWIQYLAAAFALASAAACPCSGADGTVSGPRFETYVGADYNERAASVYSTAIWSVFGPVNEPGFRLRLDGLTNIYGDTDASVFSGGFQAASLKTLSDLMAGYQFNCGQLWIKVYAGAAYQSQMRVFWEAGEIAPQQSWGAAAAVETFMRIADRVWASGNVSWQQPDNLSSFYTRGAYDIYRGDGITISAGSETAITISNANQFKEGRALDLYNDYVRAGALVNLRYGVHDLSLSGGISQAAEDSGWRPYATLRYGRQF